MRPHGLDATSAADLGDATPEQAAVLQNVVGGDGRVASPQAKRQYGARERNAVLEEFTTST
jgi:hypothetical protein